MSKINMTTETQAINKFWVSEAVLSAWLHALGANPDHESILLTDRDAARMLVVENEMDKHADVEVAEWFTELLADDIYWECDRVEVVLDEMAQAERLFRLLSDGAKGVQA